MINKKSQLGKIITTLPIMILIVIIMGVFLFLSGTLSIFNSSQDEAAAPQYLKENLLLKTIQVKLNNGLEKEMLVLDALYEANRPDGQITQKEFDLSLFFLLDKTNNCYLLFDKNSVTTGWLYKPNQRISISRSDLEFRNIPVQTISLDIEGARREFHYYLGECPDDI